jgi:Restriction endonuclease
MPQYDFSQLSAYDFETLVASLLQKEWGIRLEAFKSGRDQGIDLRYTCIETVHTRLEALFTSTETARTTIIQCKHYIQSGFQKLAAHLRKEEAAKVRTLAPERYVLVTSVGLTPANKEEIKAIFSPYIRGTSDIIGLTEINQLLERHPDIEQHNFKLWLTSKAVLDRVLHNAELCQADFMIDKIRRKLPLYVLNASYPRALGILKTSNVVVISGVPGIGKTTLADMLIYSYLSAEFAPVVIKSDLREGRALYNKITPQIFYYDDFLGQTFLRERHGFLLRNEDASLVEFIEMIQSSANAKLVMTTREHILANAPLGSERLRRSALIDHRCVLELSDYSRAEKARILYNHIYFSELPEIYRKVLVDGKFYQTVLNHRNFNPRLIEWLSSYRRIKPIAVEAYQQFVRGILDNPQEIWREAFYNQISDSGRSLLIFLFTTGGKARIDICKSGWKCLYAHQGTQPRH